MIPAGPNPTPTRRFRRLRRPRYSSAASRVPAVAGPPPRSCGIVLNKPGVLEPRRQPDEGAQLQHRNPSPVSSH